MYWRYKNFRWTRPSSIFDTVGCLTLILNKSFPMRTSLVRILLFLLFISPLYLKLTWQHNFLPRFSCNKEYVFYSDDNLWNVLAEILDVNVSSCFLYLLWLLLTSSKSLQAFRFVIYSQNYQKESWTRCYYSST